MSWVVMIEVQQLTNYNTHTQGKKMKCIAYKQQNTYTREKMKCIAYKQQNTQKYSHNKQYLTNKVKTNKQTKYIKLHRGKISLTALVVQYI